MRTKAIQTKEGEASRDKVDSYYKAIYQAIQGGATYKDLLEIEPEDYGLPKSWKAWRTKIAGASFNFDLKEENQYTVILGGIAYAFFMYDPQGLRARPGLREVAEEIGAPYAVIMDAFKLSRKQRDIGKTFKKISDD